jgi:hypothetical protein
MLCGKNLNRQKLGWAFSSGLYLCRECVPKYAWRDEEMREWAMQSLEEPVPEVKRRKMPDIPGQTTLL